MGKTARHIWNDDLDNYLRNKYHNHGKAELMNGLRRKGYKGTVAAMMEHAKKRLGLRKDEEWLRQERQRCMKLCHDKRGPDFIEKMRQRALHPAESGWWGGKHHNGCKMPREKRVEIAKKYLHTPESIAKRSERRRKSVKRDLRRVELGLEPLTSIQNIGEGMTKAQKNQRYQMCYECKYIKFRNDRTIYYDENTKRSEQRERRAESLGLTVMPLRLRGKSVITAPHYDENSRFNNDNV